MAFGLRITNTAGFVQIDEQFSCHTVYQSGTVTVAPGTTQTVNFTAVASGYPLVFLKIRETTRRIMVRAFTSSSITLLATSDETASATVDWYTVIPTRYAPAVSGTYGVIVKDSVGNITFDSRQRYPRIRQVIAADAATTTDVAYTVATMPSGGKPYFCANAVGGLVGAADTGAAGIRLLWNHIMQPSNTQINVKLGQGAVLPPGTTIYGALTSPLDFQFVMADAPPVT